mmetsp:Transcript_34545/g.40402  ORF Transcript_34545/g.40402 Transcript_34545/m.40402 type:complete len:620 (-) Transcript_34545:92-1951(-)
MTTVTLTAWSDDAFLAEVPQLTLPLMVTQRYEPCGYIMEHRRELQALLDRGLLDKNPASQTSATGKQHKDPNADADASQGSGTTRTTQKNKKVVKLSEDDLQVDWYDMLKLKTGEGSSEDQIRSAYRRRCLETHPDKQPDKSDELFKQVQRAFEILGDPDARRAYDCSRPFDDTIPGEEVPEVDFYETFGPVFERNKKWSVHSLPSIGDEGTDVKHVMKIYDAWLQFQSWRDFSHEVDLEEIDESMCREEKRFYQRENERQLNVLRRREQKRLRALVDRAMANDPRLRKKREEEEAKREAERAEREAEKRRLREEEERRRAEILEKDRLAEEERRRKILEAKDAIKGASQQLISFFEQHQLLDTVQTNMLLPKLVRSPNIQWYFSKTTVDEAKALLDLVTSASTTADADGSVPAVLAFNGAVEAKEQRTGLTRYGEPVKKASSATTDTSPVAKKAAAPSRSSAVWSEDDVILLQKAIAKFPGGTVDRWRRISVMMREKFTEEDVLTKTKELENALRSGITPAKVGAALASEQAPAASVASPASVATPASPAPAASAAAPTTPTVEDWTAKQQKQLEQGLRELKDYKEKDKFQKIAAFVEGKTAKQCFERFKYLCALNKK